MNISDEKLSAFLDAELNEQDMEHVRQAIAEDISLADRLAMLAEADMAVKAAAEYAANKPLPDSIKAMVNQAEEPQRSISNASNVVSISTKRRAWTLPVSLAAGITFVVGLTMMLQSEVGPSSQMHWASVSKVLDTNLTGKTTEIASEIQVTPQLSFINSQQQFCRQSRVQNSSHVETLIACKDALGNWQLRANSISEYDPGAAEYRTASTADVLKRELDELMDSAPLNRAQEKHAIETNWQTIRSAKGDNDEN